MSSLDPEPWRLLGSLKTDEGAFGIPIKLGIYLKDFIITNLLSHFFAEMTHSQWQTTPFDLAEHLVIDFLKVAFTS